MIKIRRLMSVWSKYHLDYFPSDIDSEVPANTFDLVESPEVEKPDYFISVAVSDTLSSDYEPTKKIVVTAYILTITAYSENGKLATEEIMIED